MASRLGLRAPSSLHSLALPPHVGSKHALSKPLALVPRSRLFRASSISATAKASVNTVKITIQGRRLPVTPAIKDYVEDKISKAVHNFAHTVKKIDVTLSARGGDTGTHGARQQKVDVTIHTLRNGIVRVEDAEESLYASIDIVCDKVSRKMRKVKEKAITKGTWPGRAGPRVDVEEEDFQEYMKGLIVETVQFDEAAARKAERDSAPVSQMPDSVVRSKVLKLDPMPVDDAIDAMEAVGHDFFVFREPTTDSVQVVYKRESGGYGILIPQ
eukprot:jgi/Chrzof1/4159/Cz14g01070.t1